MFKIYVFVYLLIICVSVSAQPWVKLYTPTGISYPKFIETYDKGIVLVYAKSNTLIIQKLSANGTALFKKMLTFTHKTTLYQIGVWGIVEDVDSGLLITGIVGNNTITRGYRLKFTPCYNVEYFTILNNTGIGSYINTVPYANHLMEVIIQNPGNGNIFLSVNQVDRIQDSIVKSIGLFTNNVNPDVKNIKKCKNGFAIVGSVYFPYPPPKTTRWLRSYFVYIDSNLNLIKQLVFNDSSYQTAQAGDVVYTNNNFFVFNLINDTPYNKEPLRPQIVKIKDDFTTMERFDLKTSKSTEGYFMQSIDSILYLACNYQPGADPYVDRAIVYTFNTQTNAFDSFYIDTTKNQYALGGLVKTYDNKLLFVYLRDVGTNVRSYAMYKYKPNMQIDSFFNDTFAYNTLCPQGVNTATVSISLDSLTSTNEVLNPNYLVSVFPNPTSSMVTITINNKGKEIVTMRLYDNTGKFVLEKPIYDWAQSFDMSSFKSGIYYMELLKGKNIIYTQKLVKVE